MLVKGHRAVEIVGERGYALERMVKVIILEDAYGEHVVAESHMCGCDGGDGGAVGENNIYRGVWGRGEKRCRDIR